jgi:glycosyltransferase involved in cell wall biosynthesis
MTLTDAVQPRIQVGILTKGRPMLAIVIANLVLQEEYPIEIFVVDTGDEPAIKRVDVVSVLRLAQDRNVRCEYELHRDRNRAFSSGRLKLLENLNGPLVAFMDDDIVLANMVAIASLARRARELGPRLGWVAPYCVNAGSARGFLKDRPHYSPGGIFAQDEVVRNILLEYYNNNSDVLDARGPRERVWELEFLTELFPALGRTTEVQHDTVSYHLDYGGGTRWDLMEEALLATTRRELNRLVAKYAPAATHS